MIEQSSPELSQDPSDEQQPEPQQPDEKQNTLDADTLLSESFAQPIRFVTYSGIRDLSEIKTKPYALGGNDANNRRSFFSKLDILFAFPQEKMDALKPHIKIRAPLKAKKLRPIKNKDKRYHVDDKLIAEATENGSVVTVVTRAGYVLKGRIQHFDKYVLYMSIGEQIVIVYRHGFFEFAVDA